MDSEINIAHDEIESVEAEFGGSQEEVELRFNGSGLVVFLSHDTTRHLYQQLRPYFEDPQD